MHGPDTIGTFRKLSYTRRTFDIPPTGFLLFGPTRVRVPVAYSVIRLALKRTINPGTINGTGNRVCRNGFAIVTNVNDDVACTKSRRFIFFFFTKPLVRFVIIIIIIILTGNTRGAHRIGARNEKKKREPTAPDSSLLRRERVQVTSRRDLTVVVVVIRAVFKGVHRSSTRV